MNTLFYTYLSYRTSTLRHFLNLTSPYFYFFFFLIARNDLIREEPQDIWRRKCLKSLAWSLSGRNRSGVESIVVVTSLWLWLLLQTYQLNCWTFPQGKTRTLMAVNQGTIKMGCYVNQQLVDFDQIWCYLHLCMFVFISYPLRFEIDKKNVGKNFITRIRALHLLLLVITKLYAVHWIRGSIAQII